MSRSTWRTSIAATGRATPAYGRTRSPGRSRRTRARIGYQFTDDINSYLRYDRGFKSGGYNDQTGTATVILDAFLQPYDPEFADSYEAGLKTTWLEGRLRLNTALFYVEYTDAQRALVTLVCVPNPAVATDTCPGDAVGTSSGDPVLQRRGRHGAGHRA